MLRNGVRRDSALWVLACGRDADSAWEQEKLEARKMLVNGDES